MVTIRHIIRIPARRRQKAGTVVKLLPAVGVKRGGAGMLSPAADAIKDAVLMRKRAPHT